MSAKKTSSDSKPAYRWSRGARRLASVAIALHVLAVFVAPWSMNGSPLPTTLHQVMAPYLHATFLDHGYQFFAPDPGPSHLIYYTVSRDGETVADGRYPDLDDHWPRLLYHRHFMMSEFLNAFGGTNEEGQYHPVFNAYVRSYARHLITLHEGDAVRLRLVNHSIPFPEDVAEGMPLDDPSLYNELFAITLTEEQL